MQGRDRISELDGWRGLAIALLLYGHFSGHYSVGRLGLEMFFVLSGRLMAQILFDQKMPLSTFFVRRFSRIYPALFVFVLAMSAAWFAGFGRRATVSDALAALTFTTNYFTVLTQSESILAHTWSLAVEEHSYLILAIIAAITIRNRYTAACVFIIIAAAMMLNGYLQSEFRHGAYRLYWQTDIRAASVIVSAGLYVFASTSDAASIIRHAALPTFLLGAAVVVSSPPDVVAFSIGTLLLAISVNTVSSGPKLIVTTLRSLPLTMLGALSYSLYLWQQPFFRAQSELGLVLSVLALIACSGLSYYFIERPARHGINAWWAKRRSPPGRLGPSEAMSLASEIKGS